MHHLAPVITRYALILLVLALSGCIPSQRGDMPAAWVDRSDAIQDLSVWTLNGRIGLRLTERGFNGALIWQQTGDAMNVDFRGPLGAGAFRVSGDPDELVLETGDGAVYLLDDPESALVRQFGWGVPLHAMRYWLTGIEHPGFPAESFFDPDGRLVSIEQLDWVIVYEDFRVFEGWLMPRKLVLENNDNVRIKLVISRWALNGE